MSEEIRPMPNLNPIIIILLLSIFATIVIIVLNLVDTENEKKGPENILNVTQSIVCNDFCIRNKGINNYFDYVLAIRSSESCYDPRYATQECCYLEKN